MYNAKNYTEQGGEKTVIGGEILINGKMTVSESAEVTGITGITEAATATVLGGIKAAAKGAGDTVEVKIDTTSSKLYVPTYAIEATPTVAGLVKQASNVADAAGATPTAAEFKALLDALKAAGIMVADV